ncbi:unnamed protein product [Anisakis simplex]|uniref:Ion_trans_2 domain-containing protein n=1 Tax=Anisakis simplex TaxID=6269 RepID=A0A0M3K189_ANISI|nr:unnamed protein product [Anisakis simplex]
MSPLSSPTCSCSISASDSSPKNYYDYDEDNDGAMDSDEISIHIPATTTTPSETFDGGSHTLATDPAAHGTDHDHDQARIANSISASSNCCYCCNCCCSTSNLQPNTSSYHQLILSEHHHHPLLSPPPTTANTLISSKTLQTATHHNDDETTNTATATTTNEAVALTAAYDQPPHFDDPSDHGNLDDPSATCKESSSKKKTSQHRKSSTASSVHSETRTNLILHNVGRTIQRTHNHLKRSRLLHAFYFFALPIYTVLGALVFQALDGEHDDSMKREYDRRCQSARLEHLDQLKLACTHTPDTCFTKMKAYLEHVESCYRTWHAVNRTITHPMSDLTNAIVYAFSVYTTIGYGNMAADTIGCRVATVIYGAFGIPLFFAFIKEEGNLFRLCFICIYKYLQKVRIRIFQWWRRNVRSRTLRSQSSAIRSTSTTQLYSTNQNGSVRRKNNLVAQPSYFNQTVAILVEKAQHFTISSPANHNNNDSTNNNDNNNTKITRNSNANIPFIRKLSAGSLFGGTSGGGGGLGLAGGAGTGARAGAGAGFRAGTGAGAGAGAGAGFRAATGTGAGSLRLSCSPKGPRKSISEQRRVFIAGVAVFIVYLLAISGVFTMMTDWDYFTAFYFLFNSVALIGFGDIFPAEPKIILVNTLFIVMGVILFSMCYFILQEEIRVKAFEASRRARMSICKYSHTIMQHTKNPWSRRNSPAFDSGSSPEPNSAFDKLRKRRQSAPAVSLTVPPPAFFTSQLTTSPPPTSTSRSPSSQHL